MELPARHEPGDRLGNILKAIAQVCWQHAWLVLGSWIIVALFAAMTIPQMSDRLLSGSGRIAGSMSDRVDTQLSSEFGIKDGQALILAYRSHDIATDQAKADAFIDLVSNRLEAMASVESVVPADELIEQRRDSGSNAILINMAGNDAVATEQAVPVVRSALKDIVKGFPGLEWAVTGRAALNHDINIFSAQDSVTSELRALPLALLVLVYAFGAAVSASLPILLAVIARTIAFAAILVVADGWDVSNLAQSIVTMLSIALGIDYSLFVYHRYRAVLQSDGVSPSVSRASRELALYEAMQQSGRVVVYSGVAVAIGMGALLLTPLMQTQSIGLGGIGAVILSVAVALTLLPASLSLLTVKALDWPIKRPNRSSTQTNSHWHKWGHFVVRHPFAAMVSSLLLLALLAAPSLETEFGFPEEEFLPAELESAVGLKMLEGMGMKGLASPVFIVISHSSDQPVISAAHVPALRKFVDRLERDERIAEIFAPRLSATSMFTPFGMPTDNSLVNPSGSRILLRVIPDSTTDLKSLRQLSLDVPAWLAVAELKVEIGGQAQFYNDFDTGMLDSYGPVILLVLVGSGLALLALLRAPLAAAKAVVLNLFSVAAGYGVVVFVFQLGHGAWLFGLEQPTAMVPTSVPIVIFAVLFGLSMDYEIFLVSRMRDMFLKHGDNDRSIVEALADTGSVITSAALIMAVVFGAFAFSRIFILQMIGLGLATAILVDALIIRTALGPALMCVAGRWNWWPLRGGSD